MTSDAPRPHWKVQGVLLSILFTVLLSTVQAKNQLPEDYTRCKKNDVDLNNCLTQAVQQAIRKLSNGIPSLGVPSIDPLDVAAIEIGQGQGPISISQKFNNIKVIGLSNATLQKTRADLDNYDLSFDGIVSNIFEADYEMSGRILVLPVTGKGRCRMVFSKMKATLNPKGNFREKGGKKYMHVNEFLLTIKDLEKMEVHFDNLFNGDKALGDSMNSLLNENWKDLWGELKPAFEETFGAVFRQFTKRIFDKVAFDDIFLE